MLAVSCLSALSLRPAQLLGSGRRQLRLPAAAPTPRAARQPVRAFKSSNEGSNGAASAPGGLVASPDHLRATKMANLCLEYFNDLMSEGNAEMCHKILAPGVQHKDMVRNEGRYGIPDYQRFIQDLKRAYPQIWVRPTQFGLVDDHTMFVAFEGRATQDTPLFKGVDLFHFNDSATKIKEIEVYRSNWLGAQGHEERKKLAQAEARAQQQAGSGSAQPRLAT